MDALPNSGLYLLVKPAPTSHAIAQPSSRGKYSHGIPVLSTNRLPVRGAQSLRHGRPLLLAAGCGSADELRQATEGLRKEVLGP
jgi:hypothetical protein